MSFVSITAGAKLLQIYLLPSKHSSKKAKWKRSTYFKREKKFIKQEVNVMVENKAKKATKKYNERY